MINNNFNKYAKSLKIKEAELNSYKNRPKGYVSPMVIEERQLNISSISVFDRLMMDRIIFLGEEIDDVVANIINAQLLFLDNEEDNTEPIWLYINSPGGDVYSGLAMYDVIQAIKAPVYTVILGAACSMAAILALSGEKKHRYALTHSRIMLHQPLGGIPFSQATDIEIYNNEMQNVKNDLIKIVSKHCNQTEEIIKMSLERDNWMTSTKAKEFGAIDKIITKI